MLPTDRNAGCSTSSGGCKTCPNAPKSPSDWFHRLGYATQTLLKLIVGYCIALTFFQFMFPTLFPHPPTLEDMASNLAFPPIKPTLSWSASLTRSFISIVLFVPSQLLDYTPLISLNFLFDMYLLATFLSKVELDIFGGYVLDFFDFPGNTLFTTTQLQSMRDESSRRENIFVRSLRTVWFYVIICGALSISFWVTCAPVMTLLYFTGFGTPAGIASSDLWSLSFSMLEASRPTRSAVTAMCAVWCFMAPRDTRLKLPFSDLISSAKGESSKMASTNSSQRTSSSINGDSNANSSSQSPSVQASAAKSHATYESFRKSKDTVLANGIKACHYPYILIALHWLMSGGSVLVVMRELLAVRIVAYYYTKCLLDRGLRDQNVVPKVFGVTFDKIVHFINVTLGSQIRRYLLRRQEHPPGRAMAIIPSTVQTFIKQNILFVVPKKTFDVPRCVCRWAKRVTTTDKMEQLKAKGALTPWAKDT